MPRSLINRLEDHADFLRREHRLVAARDLESILLAIRSTASQGTYDEAAIRKAVSFELAEIIVAARSAIPQVG